MKSFKGTLLGFAKDLSGFILLILFLILFFNIDSFKNEQVGITVPDTWLLIHMNFLSIVLEAVPFILLGVFVSALIQIYVKEEIIHRYLPKNAYAALLPAAIMGAIFPICECAIVPIVRRLIKKGMPLHVGVVFLVAAPILNPIVAASTFFAFRTDLSVLYARMGLAFILSILIGAILYIIFKNKDQLRWTKDELVGRQVVVDPIYPRKMNRMKQTMYHAADEFFLMGKYLIMGAFVASLFQTLLDREFLLAIGTNEWSSTAVMMGFAFLISLCSEADAFVAASFNNTFSTGSLVAFLVYGPMLDLKNTFMLFAFFKVRFVVIFMTVVTVVVFAAMIALQYLQIL
ncbi:permease [Halalkalibacter sp. APA_J-10(15)]|uniref:permease n=1 Tax=Halalkalibacter sp. APA_J-10(15) TaxID=2933805 RepID=UPI001FF2909A|nr:permease [Halalkalibacter sp. APA_J-10(15)]MCK0473792.1 permease [Halalkalibacter sp. APA_J-10(15)]